MIKMKIKNRIKISILILIIGILSQIEFVINFYYIFTFFKINYIIELICLIFLFNILILDILELKKGETR